jgi:hypothetical protein
MTLEMAFLFVHKSQSPFEGLHLTHGIIMLIYFLIFAFFIPNLQLTPSTLKVDDSFQTN